MLLNSFAACVLMFSGTWEIIQSCFLVNLIKFHNVFALSEAPKHIYNILCIKELLLWLNSQTEGTTGVTVVICDHRGSLQTRLAEDDAALMAEYCCPTPSFNTRGKGNETGMTLYLHSFVQCIQRKAQHMWPHIQPLLWSVYWLKFIFPYINSIKKSI